MGKANLFGSGIGTGGGQVTVAKGAPLTHSNIASYADGTIKKDRIDKDIIEQLNFATSLCLHLSEQIEDLKADNEDLRETLNNHGIYP